MAVRALAAVMALFSRLNMEFSSSEMKTAPAHSRTGAEVLSGNAGDAVPDGRLVPHHERIALDVGHAGPDGIDCRLGDDAAIR